MGSSLIAFLPNDLPKYSFQAVKHHLDDHIGDELETSHVYVWLWPNCVLLVVVVVVVVVVVAVVVVVVVVVSVVVMHVSGCGPTVAHEHRSRLTREGFLGTARKRLALHSHKI